ncbi:hypothetical protein JDV02_008388 [Purpureocillium takamizusanense]|uniref:Uncharacterized protein n=1 Tax=Purpureocillium takamizusanense TaxID=2060973 RepID=A0A9Q8VF61_9HYPO|nr:uncharacterized protein JDV02_008388 [Purpureocillium takamizusanense]UNI22502.1 hypothetical protein JDV02_008388 [Purpureocillium takamizusanense]
MHAVVSLALVAVCAAPLVGASAAPRGGAASIKPNVESAAANAAHVFNAVHSAGRQWGAALNHNGFGFFPAVVPRGTLLYHGAASPDPPRGPEWLAFEMEHAELFAQSWRQDDEGDGEEEGNGIASSRTSWSPRTHIHAATASQQRPLARGIINRRGYFHTYRARRDLKLLYIDGMAAAKSSFGPLDSQDLVLRENKTGPLDDNMWDEVGRARDVCRFVTEVGMDGFVRVEIGFEVVYCDDFATGLDPVSVTRSFMPPKEEEDGAATTQNMLMYHMARAASREYDGLGSRLRLDFSSMVSGFFFFSPIKNVSSKADAAASPDLIRLGAAASMDELLDMKHHLRDVCLRPRRFTVDWQSAVVDGLVDRFADRLASMASGKLSAEYFIGELERATLVYSDAPALPGDRAAARNRTAEAVDRCTEHHLLPALAYQDEWHLQDKLIYTAVEAVARDICQTLFEALSALRRARVTDGPRIGEEAIDRSREALRHLMDRLAWTEWKKPRPCPVDQVSFVAMYPFGDAEDHWHPGCRSIEDLLGFGRHGYWDRDFLSPKDDDDDDSVDGELR